MRGILSYSSTIKSEYIAGTDIADGVVSVIVARIVASLEVVAQGDSFRWCATEQVLQPCTDLQLLEATVRDLGILGRERAHVDGVGAGRGIRTGSIPRARLEILG